MADVKAQHRRQDEEDEAAATWPPPEVRNKVVPITDPVVPNTARALARAGAGYKITYSRGPVKTRDAPGYRVIDAVVVRVVAGQRKLVAVYHDGKFQTAFAHGVEGRVGAKLAKAYLTEDAVDVPWLSRYAWLPRH